MLKLTSCYVAPAIIHNLTVDEISRLQSFPNFSLEEAYQIGVDLLNKILNPDTEPFETVPYSSLEPYYSNIEKGMSSEDFIQQADDAGLVSEEVKGILEELNSIIKDRESIEGFDEQINQFIVSIEENTSLNDVEKMMFISAGNVSIASKNYWIAASEDENNSWYPALQDDENNANLALRLPKWLKAVFVVCIDAVGVVVGALIGNQIEPTPIPGPGATVVGGGASAASTKAFFG